MERYKLVNNRGWLKYIIILGLLQIIALVFLTPGERIGDFANYYLGAKAILSGDFNAALYDPVTFNSYAVENGYSGLFVSYAPNTPFLAFFYLPLTVFPIAIAKFILSCFGILCFTIATARIVNYLEIKPIVVILLAIVFAIPIIRNIQNGQPYLMLTAMLMEAYLCFKQNRRIMGVSLIVLASLLKLFPLVTICYLVAKRQYQSSILLLVLFVGFYVGSFYVLDSDLFIWYHQTLMPKVAFGEIVSNGFYFPFQTPFIFFKKLFVYDELLNSSPIYDLPVLVVLFTSIVSAIALYFTFKSSKTSSGFQDYAIWLVMMFLVSPYGSSYSKLFLVPIFFSLIRNLSGKNIFMLVLIACFCNFPYLKLKEWPTFLQFPGLLFVTILFVLLLKIKITWKDWFATGILASVLFFWNNLRVEFQNNASSYLLKEQYALVTDFTIDKDLLKFHYWNGSVQEDSVVIESLVDTSQVPIVQNKQIYLNNTPITNSHDLKKDPVRLKNGQIIFLSDANRGYGFYTLRVLKSEL